MYHISDSRNLPIILHPFVDSSSISNVGDTDVVRGFYGSEPEVEAMALIRNLLYARVDAEVREWVAEKRFIPRFLLAVAVFFAVFFSAAFLVRDVIPLLDELLIASAAAVTTYVVIQRKGQVSKPALEKKILLKRRIDSIQFDSSRLVVLVEQLFRAVDVHAGEFDSAALRESESQLQTLLENESNRHELEFMNACLQISDGKKRKIRRSVSRGVWSFDGLSNHERLYLLIELLLKKIQIPKFQSVDQSSQNPR